MAIELDDLSLDELKVLHARVAKAISSFVDRKKAAALKELDNKARELGFSLAESTGAAPAQRKRAPACPENRKSAALVRERPIFWCRRRGSNPHGAATEGF